MRKIHKITDIALIFMIIVGIIFSEAAYAEHGLFLRVPLANSGIDSEKNEAVKRLLYVLNNIIKTKSNTLNIPISPYSEFLKEIKGAPMPLISNKLSSSTLQGLLNVKNFNYYRFNENERFSSLVSCFERDEYERSGDQYEKSLFKKRLENPLRDIKQIERSLKAIESLNELSNEEINDLGGHLSAYYKYAKLYVANWSYVQKKDGDTKKSRFFFRKGLMFLGEALRHLESVSEILKDKNFYNADKFLSDKRLSKIKSHFKKFQNSEKDLPIKDKDMRNLESVSEFWAGISSLDRGDSDISERVAAFEKLKNSLSKETIYYFTHSFPNSPKSQLEEIEFYLGGVKLIRRFNFSICKGTEDSGKVELKNAWNPVAGSYKEMDKLDIELGKSSNFLGITGPNEVGKTTILKTAGLCILFYHMGLPIPAGAESVVGIFKNIYTIIPESIETKNPEEMKIKSKQKLSALRGNIGSRDLVLIDESTIYSDHESLAKEMAGLMEEFISKGVTVIYTTHLKDTMKLLGDRVPGVKLQQLVYEEKEKDKRTRVLKPGIAKVSDLTETLRNAGYPEALIKWTEEYYEILTGGKKDIKLSEFTKEESFNRGSNVNLFGFKDVESIFLKLRSALFRDEMFHFRLNYYIKSHWDWDTSMSGRKEGVRQAMGKWMSIDLPELEEWKRGLNDFYDYYELDEFFFEDRSDDGSRPRRLEMRDIDEEQERLIEDISRRVFLGKLDGNRVLGKLEEIDFFLNLAIESKKKNLNYLKENSKGSKIKLNNLKNPFTGDLFSIDLVLYKKVNLFLTDEKVDNDASLIKTLNLNFMLNSAGFPIMAGKGSEVPEFKNTLVFIGGEESMQEGKSYFRGIAENLYKVVMNATSDSLVLIDTLQGSDYWELSAFQLALIKYFNQIGATVILSTNMTEALESAGDTISYNIVREKNGKYALEVFAVRDRVFVNEKLSSIVKPTGL